MAQKLLEITKEEADFLKKIGMGNRVIIRFFTAGNSNSLPRVPRRPNDQLGKKMLAPRSKKHASNMSKALVKAEDRHLWRITDLAYEPSPNKWGGKPNKLALVWPKAKAILAMTPIGAYRSGIRCLPRGALVAEIQTRIQVEGENISKVDIRYALTKFNSKQYNVMEKLSGNS